ncbi:hypothetical protein KW507_16050 [Vibrio fluvialis]|nr:hypothetical protein [Vibrio fluvialis]
MFERLLAKFGYVKADKCISVSKKSKGIFEFGSNDIQELLLANAELFPDEIQQKIKSGDRFHFGIIAEASK